jgi:hypothetical protein
MSTLKTSLKLAGALAFALSAATPLMVSTASAAPYHGHMDAMHDHGHRPPMRAEHRPPMPHGHYRWRAGNWGWQHDHWGWTPGIWVRL